MTHKLKEAVDLVQQIKMDSMRLAAKGSYPYFFNVVNELLIILNADGTIIDVSDSWRRNLGWGSEDMVGRNYLDFVHPMDKEYTQYSLVEHNFLGIIRADKPYYNRYMKPDGNHVWLKWSPYSGQVFPDTGFIIGVASVVEDERRIDKLEKLSQQDGDFNRIECLDLS